MNANNSILWGTNHEDSNAVITSSVIRIGTDEHTLVVEAFEDFKIESNQEMEYVTEAGRFMGIVKEIQMPPPAGGIQHMFIVMKNVKPL